MSIISSWNAVAKWPKRFDKRKEYQSKKAMCYLGSIAILRATISRLKA
jgi:hypothetical protein